MDNKTVWYLVPMTKDVPPNGEAPSKPTCEVIDLTSDDDCNKKIDDDGIRKGGQATPDRHHSTKGNGHKEHSERKTLKLERTQVCQQNLHTSKVTSKSSDRLTTPIKNRRLKTNERAHEALDVLGRTSNSKRRKTCHGSNCNAPQAKHIEREVIELLDSDDDNDAGRKASIANVDFGDTAIKKDSESSTQRYHKEWTESQRIQSKQQIGKSPHNKTEFKTPTTIGRTNNDKYASDAIHKLTQSEILLPKLTSTSTNTYKDQQQQKTVTPLIKPRHAPKDTTIDCRSHNNITTFGEFTTDPLHTNYNYKATSEYKENTSEATENIFSNIDACNNSESTSYPIPKHTNNTVKSNEIKESVLLKSNNDCFTKQSNKQPANEHTNPYNKKKGFDSIDKPTYSNATNPASNNKGIGTTEQPSTSNESNTNETEESPEDNASANMTIDTCNIWYHTAQMRQWCPKCGQNIEPGHSIQKLPECRWTHAFCNLRFVSPLTTTSGHAPWSPIIPTGVS